MNKEGITRSRAADGGPTSQEVASRTVGGGTTHVRGNRARGDAGTYSVTERGDGLPLPEGRAPEPHGGHYFTVEDRAKYEPLIGYDKGLAPGYDPVRDAVKGDAGADERGKRELKPWTSPTGEAGCCIINHNHDGSRSMACVMAIDPQGILCELAPDTRGLKRGWKWASEGDVKSKAGDADKQAKDAEQRRQDALNAKPAAPVAAPVAVAAETPEARAMREENDPRLQAMRHGESKSDTEKAVAAKDKK